VSTIWVLIIGADIVLPDLALGSGGIHDLAGQKLASGEWSVVAESTDLRCAWASGLVNVAHLLLGSISTDLLFLEVDVSGADDRLSLGLGHLHLWLYSLHRLLTLRARLLHRLDWLLLASWRGDRSGDLGAGSVLGLSTLSCSGLLVLLLLLLIFFFLSRITMRIIVIAIAITKTTMTTMMTMATVWSFPSLTATATSGSVGSVVDAFVFYSILTLSEQTLFKQAWTSNS